MGHSSPQVHMGTGLPGEAILLLTQNVGVSLKDGPRPSLNKHGKQKCFVCLLDALLLDTQVPWARPLQARGHIPPSSCGVPCSHLAGEQEQGGLGRWCVATLSKCHSLRGSWARGASAALPELHRGVLGCVSRGNPGVLRVYVCSHLVQQEHQAVSLWSPPLNSDHCPRAPCRTSRATAALSVTSGSAAALFLGETCVLALAKPRIHKKGRGAL